MRDLTNSFALVTHITVPLGAFLDELRKELDGTAQPRAHVTMLPPRRLDVAPDAAWDYIQQVLKDFPAFTIETQGVEIFEATSAIYLAIGRGRRELHRIHEALNSGPLAFEEPFPYRPHITLAQDLKPEATPAALETARQRLADFPGSRAFSVDRVTFVRNTGSDEWIDLAQCPLAVPAMR